MCVRDGRSRTWLCSGRCSLLFMSVGVFLGPGGGVIFSLSACCAGGLGTGVCLALPLGSDGSGLAPPSLSFAVSLFLAAANHSGMLAVLCAWHQVTLCPLPLFFFFFLDCENCLPCEKNSCCCII